MSQTDVVKEKGKRRINSGWAYLIAIGVLLAGVSVAFARIKVAAMLPVMIGALQIPLTSAGWLMGVFALTSVVLSIPVGAFVGKVGIKKAGLLAVACVGAGCILGAIGQSFPILMVGRVLEGISYPLIYVVAPTSIALWFSQDRRGVPAAIWGVAVPGGSALAMNVAPRILGVSGWTAVYWLNCIMALVVIFYILFTFRDRPDLTDEQAAAMTAARGSDGDAKPKSGIMKSLLTVLKLPEIWILAGCQGFFSLAMGVSQGFGSAYLQTIFGFEISLANFAMSLSFLLCIPAAFIFGALSDRIGKRKIFLLVGLCLQVVVAALWFVNSATVQWSYYILGGISAGMIPVIVYASPGELLVKNPKASKLEMGIAAAAAMGIINTGSSIGNFLGPVLGGYAISSWGYPFGTLWCIPLLVILIVLVAWKLKLR
jgi:MFS family permease